MRKKTNCFPPPLAHNCINALDNSSRYVCTHEIPSKKKNVQVWRITSCVKRFPMAYCYMNCWHYQCIPFISTCENKNMGRVNSWGKWVNFYGDINKCLLWFLSCVFKRKWLGLFEWAGMDCAIFCLPKWLQFICYLRATYEVTAVTEFLTKISPNLHSVCHDTIVS